MKKGPFLLLFSFYAILVSAQTNPTSISSNTIRGKVIDSLSNMPLEYATISVYIDGDSKPVNGAASDNNGSFSIKNIKNGIYTLVVEFIGYLPNRIDKVVVNASKNLVLTLKPIFLVKKNRTLQTVTVEVPSKVIENKIDKIIFNADQDITSQGGVALDLLKKLPQVSVDIDGSVELAGSSSIRFLIDGKPSTAFGSNITDVLQSLPASQIKSIEVVTNPSARYDAEGLGGIINIILKKNTARGYNGNISLTTGTRIQNGSINFSARKENFGINAFINANARLAINSKTTYQRITKNASDTSTEILDQVGNSDFRRHGIVSGAGFDWTYKKKNIFSGSVNYNLYGDSGSGFLNQSQLTDSGVSIQMQKFTTNYATSSSRYNGIDANLDYKRKFDKEDRELEIAINTSFGNNNDKADNNEYLLSENMIIYGTQNENPGNENEIELQIDYSDPFAKNSIFSIGGKQSFNNINTRSNISSYNTDIHSFVFNSSLSNNLEYHERISAIYAELNFPVGKIFDAKIGGRYERTDINSFYANSALGNPGYNTFVPSIFLFKKIDETHNLKLSYSRRIERPGYDDLNPFINTSDPKNISSGNPFLKPEIGNRYELSYNLDMSTKGSLVITAFYRTSNNDIQNYIVYYPSLMIGDSTYKNVDVSTRNNIGTEKNTGISLFTNLNFTKKLTVRTNAFAFYRHTINIIDTGLNAKSLNYRFNINLSYQFAKNYAAEFFGNFNSAHHEAQGSYPVFVTYSLAIRKQFSNKKGSLAFTATNPFNQYVNRKTNLSGPGFTVTSLQQVPFRSIGINFTWKFGNLEFKKPKEENSINLNPATTD